MIIGRPDISSIQIPGDIVLWRYYEALRIQYGGVFPVHILRDLANEFTNKKRPSIEIQLDSKTKKWRIK